jgi:hypothetical protein
MNWAFFVEVSLSLIDDLQTNFFHEFNFYNTSSPISLR